jgi:HD-GYP domain-containing protein (c-di-GMP phosphodiesterase class II)
MAEIMRAQDAPRVPLAPGDLSNGGQIPTMQVPTLDADPSSELFVALAALRRGIDASAADCTDVAELERCRELATALAELEESYMPGGAGFYDLPAGGTVVVAVKDVHAARQLRRVCRYATMLTAVVAPEHIDDPQFQYGFLLHDLGMISVPDSVLANPAALTDPEWALMKGHPEFGRSLLEPIPSLRDALQIVHAHHERWDGRGYPRGLAGDSIPVGARIVALCDSFNAMTQDRPYRAASSIADARREIYRGSGGQFWPLAVDAFLGFGVSELEDVRGPVAGEAALPQPSTLSPALSSGWRPGPS